MAPLGQRLAGPKRIDDGRFRYVERVKDDVSRAGMRLDGLSRSCWIAPTVRRTTCGPRRPCGNLVRAGHPDRALPPTVSTSTTGCGSTHPEARRGGACCSRRGRCRDLCLDGDADRVILIDEAGNVGDGDQFMALMASRWAADHRLAKACALVATVMSNLGLERFLQGRERRPAGTHERSATAMWWNACAQGGFNLGGEQSGHIVMTDHATTGDGLMAGLAVSGRDGPVGQAVPRSCCANFEPVPQLLEERALCRRADPVGGRASVQAAIAQAEADLAGQGGRLLIRKSGTEPLVRVMAEHEDAGLMARAVNSVVDAVTQSVQS